jgi:Nucleolar protein 12 (25kDa)
MKPKRKDNRKRELVFDNTKRESFLKGFSKRKKLRKQKAQVEIKQKLKEECKKIKLQVITIKAG